MSKLNTYKFLTYGRLSREFKEFIAAEYPEIKCIHTDDRKRLPSLIAEVNAVAGFDFLEGLAISHLTWVHSFAAGVESLMQKKFADDCVITRTSGQLGPRIGEYCLAYMLYDLKHIQRVKDQQSAATWEQFDLQSLHDKNVLIIGTGTIGKGIARILYPLVNQVTGASKSGRSSPEFHNTVQLDDLQTLRKYDVVIGALPFTPATDKILNLTFFTLMDQALFINVGRGATVDEAALLNALDQGYIRQAVLDVFQTEPLPADSPFWSNTNVVVTPHHSGLTNINDVKLSFRKVAEAVLSGERNELFADRGQGY